MKTKKRTKMLALFLSLLMVITGLGNLSFVHAEANDEVFTLSISYHLGNEDGNMIAEPYIADMVKGEEYEVESPKLDNFTLKDENQATVKGIITSDTEVKVIYDYDKNSEKEYTIKYVAVDDNQQEYVLDTIVGSAPVNTIVPIPAKEFGGYQREKNQPTSVTVTADGKASATVKYNQLGEVYIVFETGGSYIEPIIARPGEDISEKVDSIKKPTRQGYTFDSWDKKLPTTMPNEDLIIKANWKAADTTYHVLYWGENLDKSNDEYSLLSKRVQPRKAITGTIVEPTEEDKNLGMNGKTGMNNEFYGLVYDENKTSSVKVNADGTSVLNVYYKRDEWTINFRKETYNSKADSYEDNPIIKSISGYYGTLISDKVFPSTDELKTLYNNIYGVQEIDSSNDKIIWTGINPYRFQVLVSSRKESGNVIELYPRYKENNAITKDVTINFFLEQLDGTYEKVRTFSRPLKSDTGYIVIKPYQAGYLASQYQLGKTQDEADTVNKRDIVNDQMTFDNQKLFYNVYEKRVLNKVEYKSADGKNSYKTVNNIKYGESIDLTVVPNDIPDGYQFAGWYTSTDLFNSEEPLKQYTMPSTNLVLYAKIVPVKRTVTFDTVGGTNVESQTVTNGEKAIKPEDPTKEGYKFIGWYTKENDGERWSFDRQVTTDVTLYARWSRIQTTEYRIEHIVRGESKAFYTQTTTGYIGDNVYALPLSPLDEHYPKNLTYIKATETSKSLKLEKNKENVIQFQYDIVAKKDYKISYVDIRNQKELYSESKMTLNSKVIEEAVNPNTVEALKNYVIKDTRKSQNIEKGKENVIVFECLPNNLKVTYQLESQTEGMNLPEEILKLCPVDNKQYTYGDIVVFQEMTQNEFKVENGLWVFKGYKINKESFEIKDNTKITGYWEYKKDDKLPILEVPEVLEFNVGDKFDPRDPSIIKGLSVHDDEDNLSIDDLHIEESVPREGKLLWFFTTDRTNRLTTPGTYEVIYSITDSADHTVTKTLKVKVHGLPYFTDASDKRYENQASTMYLRAMQANVNPYENLKAFYEEASDTVGGLTTIEEIKNSLDGSNQENGELSLYSLEDVNKPGVSVDNINNVGKYTAKYRAITPRNTVAEISREVFVRGNVENVNAHSIAISQNNQTKYETWDEFLKEYGEYIEMRATIDVVDQEGNVTADQEVTDYQIITPIENIPFGELKAGNRYEIKFVARDHYQNYKDSEATSTFMIDVEERMGLTPHIQIPDDYDNYRVVDDEVAVSKDGSIRKDNFLQALLDETTIYDVDNSGKKYEKTPQEYGTQNNSPGEKYGISEKGVEYIVKLKNNGEIEEYIYKKGSNDTFTVDELDDKIRKMYDTIGTYQVAYYAIDGDGNRIDRHRTIHVASQTKFVAKIGNHPGVDDIEISDVHLRQSDSIQTATGVIAYHIDPDGKVHGQPAYATEDIDMSIIQKQDITFTSTHHYKYLPGQNKKTRDSDKVIKNYYIHGPVTITGVKDSTHFMDDTVNLMNGVEATVEYVDKDEGKLTKNIDVTTNIPGNTISGIESPQKINVEYSATDNITGAEADKNVTAKSVVTMIGLPKIEAIDSVQVKEDASENDIMDAIRKAGVSASIDLIDHVEDLTGRIKYDFSDIKNGNVLLSVLYRLDSGESRDSRIATKRIQVEYIKAPIITGQDVLEMSVGDKFDYITTPHISLQLGGDKNISEENIVIKDKNIPLQDGKLSQSGTYKVEYSIEDHFGNTSKFLTTIYVDGLVEFTGNDINAREGYGINLVDGVTGKYLEALPKGHPVLMTAKVEVKDIKDYEGNIVKETDVINNVGQYTITYIARNGHGKETEWSRKVNVHGQIQFDEIGLKESFVGNSVDLLDGVTAKFKMVHDDGSIEEDNADITTKVKNTTIDSDKAEVINVIYTVTDNKTGVTNGKTVSKEGLVKFVENPIVTGEPFINIDDDESQDSMIKKANAKASVKAGDEIIDLTKNIQYKFDVDKIIAIVEYTVGGKTRKAQCEIMLNHAPTIEANDVEIHVGDAFDAMNHAKASDKEDGDLTEAIKVVENTVDTTKPGTYTVTYTVTDSRGLTATKSINVRVLPKQVEINHIPTIEADDVEIHVGDSFDAMNHAKASDKEDGDLTEAIKVVENTVDTTKPGTYTVTYTVTDSRGLTATKSINVKVLPKQVEINHIPTIEADDVEIHVGDSFDAMNHAKASDKEDGDLTEAIKVVENTVDTTKPGTYTVTYTVTDSHGLTATKSIKVVVQEVSKPDVSVDFDDDSNDDSMNDHTTIKQENSTEPQTGDMSSILLWGCLSVISAGVYLVLGKYKNKEELK